MFAYTFCGHKGGTFSAGAMLGENANSGKDFSVTVSPQTKYPFTEGVTLPLLAPLATSGVGSSGS